MSNTTDGTPWQLMTRSKAISKFKFRTLAFLASPLLVVPGCASITSSSGQVLSIEAVSKQNEPVSHVECQLSNDKGRWQVTAPGTITIQKSASDLIVNCEKKGHEPGSVRAISRVGAGMWGNLIIGGGVGAIIDHTKGVAYNYPSIITVVMGETNTLPKPKAKQKK